MLWLVVICKIFNIEGGIYGYVIIEEFESG